MELVAAIVLGTAAAVIGADAIYASWTNRRLAAWEATVERNADGVRAGCEEFEVGEGAAAAILVHGFADSPLVWRGFAEALAEHDVTCRAIRLPGFAKPMEAFRRTRLRDWLDHLDRTVHALEQTHDEVWLIGHSMGGALVTRYALEQSRARRVDGIVLLAPLIEVSSARSPVLSPRAWYRIADNCLIFTDVIESPFSPNVTDSDALEGYTIDRFIPRQVYQEMFQLADSIEDRAPELEAPLLLITGGRDRIIDSRAAESFFEAAGSSRKRRLSLPDAGHLVSRDRGWRRGVEAAADFILEQREK